MTHYPIDSLVSALGEAYPQVGVGRQFEDAATTSALAVLLEKWVPHLDYEQAPYVLEGYHVDIGTAERLARRGLRVAALGYETVDPDRKVEEIRSFGRRGDWASGLSDSRLLDVVRRCLGESRQLRIECERRNLPYFETGEDAEAAHGAAFELLSGKSGGEIGNARGS